MNKEKFDFDPFKEEEHFFKQRTC